LLLMKRRLTTYASIVAGAAGLAIVGATQALALEVRRAGKISVPGNAQVVAFSTDSVVADVLRQDFEAEHRGADANATDPVTLSVSVNEQSLRPGVSLQDLAPGDPEVEGLIKAAGATPPPVGDTGTDVDQAALARARAQNNMLPPGATPMQTLMNTLQAQGNLGQPTADPSGAGTTPPPPPGSPGYTGDTADYMSQGYESAGRHARQLQASDFDNVIVARVSISGSPDEMTVVAVYHPGEDEHDAKKMIAEEIVNAALH